MGEDTGSNDYVIRVVDDPAAIDAVRWNALLEAQPSATPFMRHEYLAALHASGSACEATGWSPRFLALFEGQTLGAACPLYLTDHSYGEYVFDWAWADAYQRHGLAYYPKLLGAVPFTPVPGARLLARDDADDDLVGGRFGLAQGTGHGRPMVGDAGRGRPAQPGQALQYTKAESTSPRAAP